MHPFLRIAHLLPGTLAGALLGTFGPCQEAPPGPAAAPWAERAEAAQQALVQRFWNDEAALFEMASPHADDDKPFQYWWQAHAIDALVDGFERSGRREYLERATRLWAGVQRRIGGVTNEYYDDMLWMALALQRLQAHTGSPALRDDVQTLWQDVQKGWNDAQGGGIAWRKTQLDYKNTPANAPAVVLAARLSLAGGDGDDLAFGKRVYAWLTANLVDPETGFAWDGKNRKGDGATDKDWAFTYNQGVCIGAADALFAATGDARFRRDGDRTFAAAVKRLTDARGVLKEAGKGDGGLFKGILVRYVGDRVHRDPAHAVAERAFLVRQAEAAWTGIAAAQHAAAPVLFGPVWGEPAPARVELSAQLSGVFLCEQMARTGTAPR